jgi:integrase
MASLVEIKGNYYLQFYDGNKSPERKKIALGTKRKRVAKKLQRRYEDAYALGEYDPWTGKKLNEPSQHLNVEDALKLFLEAKAETGRAERTIDCYEDIISRTGVSDVPMDSVQKSDIDGFIYDPDVADATRHKRFRHWRAFLNWCESEGYCTSVPDLPEPETYDKLPKAVREEELDRICEAMRCHHKQLKSDGNLTHPDAVVWRIPLFRFAFLTGMRRSEIGRLRWEHVSLERRELLIEAQKNKSVSLLPLSAPAAGVLEDLGHRAGFVFCGPRTDPVGDRNLKSFCEAASKAFLKYRRRAGIDRPVSFHGLRHGFCSKLAEQGCSAHTIQRLARHDSIESSQRYIHLSNHMLRRELDDAFGQ